MKKKKMIIWCAVILLVAVGLFFLAYNPPGGEEWPLFVPRADRSDVGKTVTLSVDKMLAAGQTQFVYIYDPEDGTGRLALFGGTESSKVWPVVIYEPQWSGGKELCSNITGEFEAKIVEIVNVGFIEGTHIYETFRHSQSALKEYSAAEVIDIETFSGFDSGTEIQYYFGNLTDVPVDSFWHRVSENAGISLVGGTKDGCSEKLSFAIERLHTTASRYFLKDDFGF